MTFDVRSWGESIAKPGVSCRYGSLTVGFDYLGSSCFRSMLGHLKF